MSARGKRSSLYSAHPSLKMEESYATNLKERTGKTLEQWVELVKASGPPTEKERRVWLKEQHNLTTNYAWWVAERAEGRSSDDYDPEALVEALFAGKAGLRPLYDELLKLGLGLGADVKACPCKTMVPLYRRHVFAQLKPTTRTRLDLGLALKDAPFSDRLLDTGGRAKDDRITHRIAIATADDIDDEVRRWLRAAYDLGSEAPKSDGRKKAKALAVPDDFATALRANARAQSAFDKLPPSHQNEHVKAITEAKKADTRARRIAQAITMLAKGAIE
jgi:hypothetical protein